MTDTARGADGAGTLTAGDDALPKAVLAALDRFRVQTISGDVEPRDDDTWAVIDTKTADPMTNWPGELVSEHPNHDEARIGVMKAVLAVASGQDRTANRKLCPSCQGSRGGMIGESGGSPDWDNCWTCNGEGFVPAPAATPGVPDSVRALSEIELRAADAWLENKRKYEHSRVAQTAIDTARAAISALIAAQPAGQSEGRLSRERGIVVTWDRDIAPALDRLEAIARRMGAPAGSRLIQWAADKLEEIGAQPAGQAGDAGAALWSAWPEDDCDSDPRIDPVAQKVTEWFVGRWPRGAEEPECRILIGEGRSAEIIARRIAEKLTSVLNTDAIQARAATPAPNSTRTGAAETGDKLVRLLAAVSDRLRDNPPNGLVEGDLYVAAKNEGPDSGWRYVPTGLTVGDLDEARALIAARPEAPSDAGWLDMPLAADLEFPGVKFGKGVALRTVIEAARRWKADADAAFVASLPTPPSDPAPSGQAEG